MGALFAMSEATGMAILHEMDMVYPEQREKEVRMEILEETHKIDPKVSLEFVRGALARGVVSVGLVGVLENALQVYLQALGFTLTAAEDAIKQHSQWNLQTVTALCSIILSAFMCLLKLKHAKHLISFAYTVRQAIHEDPWCESSPHVIAEQWKWIYGYLIILCIFAGVLAYSIAAASFTIIGVFHCQHSLWILGSGCIDLQGLCE